MRAGSLLLLVAFKPHLEWRVKLLALATQTATLLTLLVATAHKEAEADDCECGDLRTTLRLLLPLINLMPLLVVVCLVCLSLGFAWHAWRGQHRPPPPGTPAVLLDLEPVQARAAARKLGSGTG